MQTYKFINTPLIKQFDFFMKLQTVENIEKVTVLEIMQDNEFYPIEDHPEIYHAILDAYLETYLYRNPLTAPNQEDRANDVYKHMLLFQVVMEDIYQTTFLQCYYDSLIVRLDKVEL